MTADAMRWFLWLLGQFIIVIAGGAVIIAVVIAIWYGVSFGVLTVVSRAWPLRGRNRRS